MNTYCSHGLAISKGCYSDAISISSCTEGLMFCKIYKKIITKYNLENDLVNTVLSLSSNITFRQIFDCFIEVS